MWIEKMLRMYLLQIWFNLSDPATEDTIYDKTPSIVSVEYDLDKHKLAFLNSNLFSHASGIAIRDAVDMVKHKRKCFSYEKEVRIVIQDVEHSGQETQEYLIQDKSSFISGVMVHPDAKPEYVKMIGTLCEAFSLNFYGKSKIYELDTSLFQPNEQNDISQTAQGGLKWTTRAEML